MKRKKYTQFSRIAVGTLGLFTVSSCAMFVHKEIKKTHSSAPKPGVHSQTYIKEKKQMSFDGGALRGAKGVSQYGSPHSSFGHVLVADEVSHYMPRHEEQVEVEHNTENYSYWSENSFKSSQQDPLSTFSADVDTASYSNLRRYLNQGTLPPKDAVRIEELINYFPYAYEAPKNSEAFSVHVENTKAPWNVKHGLVKIGIKGKEIEWGKRPSSNLVFLIDVSGSMMDPNKLPLVKKSLALLVEQLGENDRISLVVYASATGVVLPSTSATNKTSILQALDRLEAGGSTNGSGGIQLAYSEAQKNFISGGINRVILATDGDFNVGISSEGELVRLIEEKAKSQVFLTVLGFGSGNLKDSHMQKMANHGNGQYAYIDSEMEAKKVLVSQAGGTLMTIAKDVKIQVEFNPKVISSYRLIGYEKRNLRNEDFNDDLKDAGDIGSGHTVTALYEVVPVGEKSPALSVDPLKYQKVTETQIGPSDEALTVKVRYKKPDESKSQLISQIVKNHFPEISTASNDLRFAASVASFGMLLKNSEHKGSTSWQSTLELAESSTKSSDELRQEYLKLLQEASKLDKKLSQLR